MKNLTTQSEAKNSINGLLNLKFELINSLKKQGTKSNWIYPTLRTLNLHSIYKENK